MASKFSRGDNDKKSTQPWVLFVIAMLGQTGLTGYFTKEKELKIAEQQLKIAEQQSQVTKDTALQELQLKRDMAVVTNALDPNRSAEDREQVVNFLIATTKDEATRAWAVQKKASLQSQVTELKGKLEASEAQRRAYEKEISVGGKKADLQRRVIAQRQLIAALEDEVSRQSTKSQVITTTTTTTTDKVTLGSLLVGKTDYVAPGLVAVPTIGSAWQGSDSLNTWHFGGSVNTTPSGSGYLRAVQAASYTGAISVGGPSEKTLEEILAPQYANPTTLTASATTTLH